MTNIFLKRCNIGQLQKLIERYQLKPKYASSHRKRYIMEKILAKYVKTNGIGDCPICFEPNNTSIAIITPCVHIFCDACILQHLQKNHTCPMCRESTDYIDILKQVSYYRIIVLYPTLYKKYSQPRNVENIVPFVMERVSYIQFIVTISTNVCINIMNAIIISLIFFNFLLFMHIRIFFQVNLNR